MCIIKGSGDDGDCAKNTFSSTHAYIPMKPPPTPAAIAADTFSTSLGYNGRSCGRTSQTTVICAGEMYIADFFVICPCAIPHSPSDAPQKLGDRGRWYVHIETAPLRQKCSRRRHMSLHVGRMHAFTAKATDDFSSAVGFNGECLGMDNGIMWASDDVNECRNHATGTCVPTPTYKIFFQPFVRTVA